MHLFSDTTSYKYESLNKRENSKMIKEWVHLLHKLDEFACLTNILKNIHSISTFFISNNIRWKNYIQFAIFIPWTVYEIEFCWITTYGQIYTIIKRPSLKLNFHCKSCYENELIIVAYIPMIIIIYANTRLITTQKHVSSIMFGDVFIVHTTHT